MTYLILTLGIALLGVLLYPLLIPSQQTPQDIRRTELQEERDLLLADLEQLQGDSLMRQKVRLAQVLHELDLLPPVSEAQPAPRSMLPVGATALAAVLAFMLLGAMTFFNDWRMAGLSEREATQLSNVSRLPNLQATAERTGAVADYEKLGDAAWQARRYKLAAQAYTQVLSEQRDNAKALRRTGFFLLRDEKMAQDGLAFIARAAALDPKDPESPLIYGYALGMFGQFEAGLKELKQHQALAPQSTEADELIVEFQQRTGQKVEGALVYKQHCAACHGTAGQGGTGPQIANSVTLKNPDALRTLILKGATGMPAFPQLEGPELDALLQTLGEW